MAPLRTAYSCRQLNRAAALNVAERVANENNKGLESCFDEERLYTDLQFQ